MDVFSFVSPEIIFGPGTISQCGESAVRLGAHKVLVVTDSGIVKSGWLDQVKMYLQRAGLEYVIWSDVSSNPKDVDILGGVEQYRRGGCDVVLAVGGGSPIDAAKAVALLASNGGKVADYEEIDSIKKPLPPMIAMPTTAGSGSEVSQFSIIVNTEEKRKMTLVSKSLIPYIAIYDPDFLNTLDNRLMVYSAFNILSHAIEAFVSVASTPMTDLYALNAIKVIAECLNQLSQGIRSTEMNCCMAMANLESGLAFSNAILGAVHAMTHQICVQHNLPAGLVDAVLLPKVMEFNLPAARYKYGLIAGALGEKVVTPSHDAGKAVKALDKLVHDLKLPTSLSQLGIKRELLPQLATNVFKDVCLVTNPKELSHNDVVDIITRSF
jgi:1,3-propanediol dehydrogenase